ncbi:MAG TPA: mandelate racemase/muconate lactonizing enzyme family protein [Caldimonas sp.]|jgi:L-alanine-DL-glutamate epimerase-like enolase superfamily enzyme|nr:mandelate racemase/muconate lactonizing enzyme family protein [Caldimonas sp.]HEX2543083.1 mandelate racemase/muconate lactonizing enzyme family protein [Caldimonas sp.]
MNDVHRESTASTASAALAKVEAHVLRWPVRVPVRTSFGTMHDRPAVLVRVEDVDGAHGWGEAWCNFPSCGAEHRSRLVETVLAPLLVGCSFASPLEAFEALSRQTAVLALQSGEPGPMAQAIAGVDIALHDLAARRAGRPLWQMLAADRRRVAHAPPRLRVYASGINPEGVGATVSALRAAGHAAFKLKVGFGAARDLGNLREARDAAGTGAMLMADANQAWDLHAALDMTARLAAEQLAWLEEPLRADRPMHEWRMLAATAPMPLAAGENAIGDAAFDALIGSRAVTVVQPDVAKWGGVSGVLRVIERIEAAGLRYCPHYLGAGIGLLASAHVLAARGTKDALLEVDSNENPLRTALCPPLEQLDAGRIALTDQPGLGIEPDLAQMMDLCAR